MLKLRKMTEGLQAENALLKLKLSESTGLAQDLQTKLVAATMQQDVNKQSFEIASQNAAKLRQDYDAEKKEAGDAYRNLDLKFQRVTDQFNQQVAEIERYTRRIQELQNKLDSLEIEKIKAEEERHRAEREYGEKMLLLKKEQTEEQSDWQNQVIQLKAQLSTQMQINAEAEESRRQHQSESRRLND